MGSSTIVQGMRCWVLIPAVVLCREQLPKNLHVTAYSSHIEGPTRTLELRKKMTTGAAAVMPLASTTGKVRLAELLLRRQEYSRSRAGIPITGGPGYQLANDNPGDPARLGCNPTYHVRARSARCAYPMPPYHYSRQRVYLCSILPRLYTCIRICSFSPRMRRLIPQ